LDHRGYLRPLKTWQIRVGRVFAHLGFRDHHLISDVIQESAWWAAPRQQEDLDTPPCAEEALSKFELPRSRYGVEDDPEPFVRESPKIGRNDPCLCGSGKKFKKCCGS
jgi:uncharacterized protein YecA (UPF0149 family)